MMRPRPNTRTPRLCQTARVSAPPEVPDLVARCLDLSRQQGFITATRNETGRLLAALAASRTGTLAELGTGCGVGSAWLHSGMGDDAVAAIAHQAQGNPLFAVETVRSLIDRDAVIPVDGVYQLVGAIGELTVPDSLHGLLAARLDALDPDMHALVADAAVLGISFPAEALAAVSGRSLEELRPMLTDLVHRDVLEISADPLSPQRGHYHFGQNLLRQVAYETLSRRDRKTRHVAVAAHLRGVFANDGDEVADVKLSTTPKR